MANVTRFAPSPTGLLHVGNVRVALINWLFTKKHDGRFILRMDDTDFDRSEEKFERAIMEDLEWLGITWDKVEHQKDRIKRYDEVKQRLIKAGRLYPCYESEEELAVKRKIQLAQGKPPIYDRSALSLNEKQILEYEREGKRPHFRFKLEHKEVGWDDMIRGVTRVNAGTFSDPVVIRENGTWTYMLCSVVDDIDFNITHIIRGDDHISNTVAHIQFFEALDAGIPVFGHLSRIASKTEKISKRKGGFDIKTLREEKGIEPMTINSFLALTGTSKDIEVHDTLEGLVSSFDVKDFHKSPTNYDEQDLVRLNHKVLSQYSFAFVKKRLEEMDLSGVVQEFWLIIRNNIDTLMEVKSWYHICYEEIQPVVEDKEFLAQALSVLPSEKVWTEKSWDKWIESIKTKTKRKGKELFKPLRLALTSVDYGPELKFLLPLMGKKRIEERLKGNKA